MKERPILFSGEMVRAILDGKKTQTRRVVKTQPDSVRSSALVKSGYETKHGYEIKCPYGQPGDRLWVRETLYVDGYLDLWYKADDSLVDEPDEYPDCIVSRKETAGGIPSIFMPRWASRINLKISNISVERLQDISEDDAEQEGTTRLNCGDLGNETFKSAYRRLWEKINGSGSWDKNPWVWVVEFRRMS